MGLWPSKGAHDNAESECSTSLSWRSRPIHRLLTTRADRMSPPAKNLTLNWVAPIPFVRSSRGAICKIRQGALFGHIVSRSVHSKHSCGSDADALFRKGSHKPHHDGAPGDSREPDIGERYASVLPSCQQTSLNLDNAIKIGGSLMCAVPRHR